ncbi:5'-methylthioadenosine/S-adenosylhomocysteine nucleosidase [Radiobacillus sp. PE A8.2]|uniref:5'-methylthioadenosine/S-adenosylhomocysteine nucleosidase n=1 Tax=Radiobacillus sp. PE A8.2 TaxID=3380349 RepID=UPI00388FD202
MTIGIIGAMDEEVELLQKNMTDTKQQEIAGCVFTEGLLKGKQVVLLKSGIGKVNAAIATTILHEIYKPEKIINTGSAGGFAKELEVGDIVVSTTVVYNDVDVTAFDYAYGQVPGLPAAFTADETLISQAMKATEIATNCKAMQGMIATGDAFMSDPERVEFIRSKFPTMIAAEMEAAAIAHVCHQYDTPFVIIRALSDIAGKEASVSFETFLETAATNAATLIMEMVSNID